jgi:cell division protein FtsN
MPKGARPTLRLIDRLVLVVAWLVTGGIAYVLGYYVGRGTPERHAAIEERSVRLPVTSTPPPEGQRPKAEREFPSFYQTLPAGERPIDVARGTPVTAPPTAGPTSAARTTTLAPPTTLARTPTVPTQTTVAPRAVATTSTTLARTTTTPPAPMAVPRAVTATTTPAPSAPPTTLARTASRGGYTVEASPTRSRSEAEQLMATLRRRGYDATLVQVERDGDTWYRLRVGRYPTSEQATDTMRRLRDVEGVTHVFVATD